MATPAVEIANLYDGRWSEAYIIQRRDEQQKRYSSWKSEIRALRAIVDGDWRSVFPSEVAAESYDEALKVQNLCRDSLEDVGRLATESRAAIRLEPPTRKQLDEDKAELVEAIASGYWRHDYSEEMVAELAMDMWGDGGAFVLSLPRVGFDYPCHTRLDPLHVYPDIFDREMQDCLVVTSVKERWAARKWPWLGLDAAVDNSNDVEVIDLYAPDEIVKVVRKSAVDRRTQRQQDQAFLVDRQPNPIGRVPIAWAKLPSKDGGWRGGVLQAASTVNSWNRIITMVLDNAENVVYSPVLNDNVANPEVYGPNAILEKDNPTMPASMQRQQPAMLQGGLFALTNEMEQSARGSLAFPAGRQGEVSQAIASASFVNATLGQETTVVRFVQREGIGRIRRMQSEIDMDWDRKVLNFLKPLLYPAGNRKNYVPGDELGNTRYRIECVYGMYAGMDLGNRLVALQQLSGNLFISRETGRAQLDEMAGSDYRAEEQRIERQQVLDIAMQKVLADPNYDTASLLAAMNDGNDFMTANAMVVAAAQRQAQMAAQAAQQQPALPGQVGPAGIGGAPTVADQNAAMGAGAIPQNGPQGANPAVNFAPPPASTITVGRVQGRAL